MRAARSRSVLSHQSVRACSGRRWSRPVSEVDGGGAERRCGAALADRQCGSLSTANAARSSSAAVRYRRAGSAAKVYADSSGPAGGRRSDPRLHSPQAARRGAPRAGFGLDVGFGDGDAHYRVYAESVRNLGTPVFPAPCSTRCAEFGGDADILTISRTARRSPRAQPLFQQDGLSLLGRRHPPHATPGPTNCSITN